MEVGESILKGSGDYNIRDNIMSALAAFSEVAIEVPQDERHQHIPHCYGNLIAMSTSIKLQ